MLKIARSEVYESAHIYAYAYILGIENMSKGQKEEYGCDL